MTLEPEPPPKARQRLRADPARGRARDARTPAAEGLHSETAPVRQRSRWDDRKTAQQPRPRHDDMAEPPSRAGTAALSAGAGLSHARAGSLLFAA